MAKKKLLFVSKDMGASEMSMPLAELAYDAMDYDVSLVLEGLAAPSYDKLNARRTEAKNQYSPFCFAAPPISETSRSRWMQKHCSKKQSRTPL